MQITQSKSQSSSKNFKNYKHLIKLIFPLLILILLAYSFYFFLNQKELITTPKLDEKFEIVGRIDKDKYSIFIFGFITILSFAIIRILYILLQFLNIIDIKIAPPAILLTKEKPTFSQKIFKRIEILGNKLPHPFFMFIYFLVFLFFITFFLSLYQVELKPTKKDGNTSIINLLDPTNFSLIFDNLLLFIRNNPIIWQLIVVMLGVATAEKTGLFDATILRLTKKIPQILVVPFFICICVNSSIAADVGYLLLIPLGGQIWKSLKKNPISGIVTSFISVSAGYGASFLPGSSDITLFEVGNIVLKENLIDINLNMSDHFYFIIFSTIILTFTVSLISIFLIDPIVEKKYPNNIYINNESEDIKELSSLQKKGLRNVYIVFFISVLIIGLCLLNGGPLSDFKTGKYDKNKNEIVINIFMNNIVLIIAFVFFAMGLTYGITTKKLKSKQDLFNMFTGITTVQVPYLLITMVSVVFTTLFAKSGLAQLITEKISNFLESIKLTNEIILLVIFAMVVALFNIINGSFTSKLMMLAPIFIPLFYSLKIDPVKLLAFYRIADSPTNVVSPINPYIILVIGFCQKHITVKRKNEFQMGSILSLTIIPAIILLITWTISTVIFLILGIPFGPMI